MPGFVFFVVFAVVWLFCLVWVVSACVLAGRADAEAEDELARRGAADERRAAAQLRPRSGQVLVGARLPEPRRRAS